MPKKAIVFLSIFCFAFASPVFAQGNTANDSFARAKKNLAKVYADHRQTIYCGFSYDGHGAIDLPAGFQSDFPKRASKVEWEHAVPAENFGRTFREWREGDPACVDNRGKTFKGRNCASKVNMEYRFMQADMHNLFPASGAVNAARSNKRYAMLPELDASFGVCPAKTDKTHFEPPDAAKGQVARTALYMEKAYPRYRIGEPQKKLFLAWDRQFPVTKWECERQRRIEKIQGNANMIVKNECEKAGL